MKKADTKILYKLIIIFIGLVFFAFPVLSSFNAQLNYQGKLTDSSNTAVTDGDYNIEFKLWDSATATSGANLIWTETCTSTDAISLTSGLFSHLLGSVTSLSGVDFNQELWLGINIGGVGTPSWDGEMSPRKKLGAVPAAFEADKLDGIDSTSFLRSDATDTASGALTFSNTLDLSATTTLGASANLYFAGGTTYYINNLGNAVLNTLNAATTTITGTLRALGSIDENAQGIDRIDIGVQNNTPRMAFEDSGSTIWLVDNSAGKFRWYIPEVEQMNLETVASSSILTLRSASADAIKLNTNGNSYFNNGNVGIGTSSPSALLSIGATTGSQFLVNTTGTITDGTWQGSPIANDYIASSTEFLADLTDDTVSGTELDGTFSTTGILRRTAAGTYSTVTDNSTDWNSAYGWGDWNTNIDISTDTNLATSTGITLTGDTLGWSSTGLTWVGNAITNSYIASSTEYLANTTYTATGTLVQLTGTQFGLKEGTLSNGKFCTYDTSNGLVCDSDAGATLTQEQVEDFAGNLIATTTGTHTRMSVTYDDASGNMDFVVDDMNDDVPEAADYSNLTASTGIDMAVTGTLTFDSTELDALTWSDGTNASNAWTFDVSGTDHTMTAGSGMMTFSNGVTATGGFTGALTGNADTVTGFTPASGSLTLSGADALTLTTTGATNVTLPTTGTLVNSAVATLSSLTSVGTISTGTWQGTAVADAYIASSTEYLADNNTDIYWTGTDVNLVASTGRTSLELDSMALLPNTGSTTITTLGTITAGTWNGTAIDNTYIASMTSANLAGIISDESGTGVVAFTTSPVFTTPNIGVATGSVSGNAGTATTLETARNIGGVSFDGSTSIVPTTIAVTDTADTAAYIGLWESATGDLLPQTDAGLTYNAGTGMLTSTGLTGALTGNADTVTGFTPASGSLTLSGADALTLTTTGATNVTLPTTGTLVNSAVATLSSLTSVGTIGTGTWQGIAVADAYIASSTN